MPLHLSRVAFACRNLEDIASARDRFAITCVDGRRQGRITSRRTPRRELAGGSLYWIIAHHLVARQAILAILPEGAGPGCEIRLSLDLVPVVPTPFRSHQGWRYLDAGRAPRDLLPGEEALPPTLQRDLATLGLA